MTISMTIRTATAVVLAAGLVVSARSEDPRPATSPAKQYEQAVKKAVNYLQTKGQTADGSFSAQAGPAVTAVALAGMLRNGRSADEPSIVKGFKYLAGFMHDDGGIYVEGSHYKNYETCLAMLAFAAGNKDHRFDKQMKNAEKFIKELQWDTEDGHDLASPNFGGAGYGGSKRPDLSNTAFLLDALKSAGAGADDEAVKKALVFVSRCQNLESEHNTTPFPAKNPDGGFYYTPAAGGSSQAGNTPDGGLRSYGSMTYAGLKSMIFAGVGPDDPRVKAAYKWAQNHYDLANNPGMGTAGLYYYYHTFAKALDAIGKPEIEDADGKQHNWRNELLAELVRRQQPDGSWINENSRWLEGDANLVTGYALLTLHYCRPQE